MNEKKKKKSISIYDNDVIERHERGRVLLQTNNLQTIPVLAMVKIFKTYLIETIKIKK